MKVLVINAGSSSIKYQLFDMTNESVLASGLVERIGMDSSILTHKPTGKEEVVEVKEILDHVAGVKRVIELLTSETSGVIKSMDEVDAVGHRIVHGGETFKNSVLVTEEVKQEIKRLYSLAPLHNPAHMMGILGVEANLPNVPQVVVFDTAFHQTMPKSSFMYALPQRLYKQHQVRRYGFHGTSHKYVSDVAAQVVGKDLKDLKVVTCHIGNGGSLTAVKDGKSFDTSMGMTPLEGLMMGTRSGDMDPAIVPYVMAKEDLTINEVNSMLNKHSGLLAISGLSSDMREITDTMHENENAKLAFDMYVYRVKKYIGSYAAAMNGLDVLVFTAGVGENSIVIRQAVCEGLTFFGIEIDEELNKIRSKDPRVISKEGSKVKVLVIPTNEELIIARDTFNIINNKA